jgi:hypothetical protein
MKFYTYRFATSNIILQGSCNQPLDDLGRVGRSRRKKLNVELRNSMGWLLIWTLGARSCHSRQVPSGISLVIELVTSLSPTCLTTPPCSAPNQRRIWYLSRVTQHNLRITAVFRVAAACVLSMEVENMQPIHFHPCPVRPRNEELYFDESYHIRYHPGGLRWDMLNGCLGA